MVESIIFRLGNAKLYASEKVSTSGLSMPFFVGKFQLPARRLVLGLDRIPPSCRGIYYPFEMFKLPAAELRSA